MDSLEVSHLRRTITIGLIKHITKEIVTKRRAAIGV
jgi:hypothetical protein